MPKLEIEKWEQFNRFTIIKEVKQKWYNRYFECKCNCWNIKIIRLTHLRSWDTVSCWCYSIENLQKRSIKHWLSKTRIYNIWAWVQQRCNYKNSISYKNYGWRWIKCEWNAFGEFYSDIWDSYNTHFKSNNGDTTIDRIDNNWNYNNENCRWTTMKEQQRNKNNNVNYRGMCVSERCEMLWLNVGTVFTRINRYWWSIKKALWLEWNDNPVIIDAKAKFAQIKEIINR